MVLENSSNPFTAQNSLLLEDLQQRYANGLDVALDSSMSTFRSASPLDTQNLSSDSLIQASATDFTSGFFTVGSTGHVVVDYLFDGGGYSQGELAMFSLQGLESLGLGSPEFFQEAARRALSNSTLGHVVVSDRVQGARFSGSLPWEDDFNSGDYLGGQTFAMNPGDRFGFMLVPNGTIQQVFDYPNAPGELRPLFSLGSANPNSAFQFSQIADVDGKGHTFTFEDLRLDGESDRDYNEFVIQVRGAIGAAVSLDQVIDPAKDWRQEAIGQALLSYAAAYNNPPTTQTTDYRFPQANQPLIGIIDTGFAANNPDIDYGRIVLGRDYVDGDANPLLAPGEGNEHGTHILGIIGATQNNGIGIDGLNDQAPIWVGRAIGSGKWADSLVDFVNQALESNQPHAVINLSLDLTQRNADGSITTRYEFTPQERAALEYARQNGVVIVAAAGNDGGVMSALGQASQEFDNIITVGAADGLNRAAYSSYGYGLDILAPGGTTDNGILSTVADGVGTLAGTSVATAHVSGAIAQVWAANPGLSYRQVIEILKITARDVGLPDWDLETGAGLLNIDAAIQLAQVTEPKEHYAPASMVPETWTGEGKVTPIERAVGPFNYPIRNESFSGWVGPSIGVNLRYTPWLGDRSSSNEPYRKTLQFDAWTYGERGTDLWLGTADELWYRVAGTNLWVPSAYIYGYPGSRPPVLAPSQPNPSPSPTPNPSPNPTPQPIPFVPINANSPNYRSGALNPYAYHAGLIGQCTWYAYGRMRETGLLPQGAITGALFRGNAYTWANDARRLGLPVTSTPKAGARGLVVWPPGVRGAHSAYGHVAFLEEVYPDGRIRISESNWGGVGIKERILPPAQYSGVQFVQLENARAGSVPAAAIPGRNQQYIIKAGDTLSGIAQRYLGNANRWREIMKTPTGGTFTDAETRTLQVGQSVYLPVVSSNTGNNSTGVVKIDAQPITTPKVEKPKDGWGYVTRPGETYRVGLERVDGSMTDIRDRPTWIVIHGMNDSPNGKDSSIPGLASAIGNYQNDDQVFTLDWSSAAFSDSQLEIGGRNIPNPKFGASWITQVAEFVKKKVQEWGIAAWNVNVVGHSLGSFVSYEVAKQLGNINRLIALDPATTTNGGYADSSVNFSKLSRI